MDQYIDGGMVLTPFPHALEPIGKKSVLESSEDVIMGGNTINIADKFKNLDRMADTIGVRIFKN